MPSFLKSPLVAFLAFSSISSIQASDEKYKNGMVLYYLKNQKTQTEHQNIRIAFLYSDKNKTHLLITLDKHSRNSLPKALREKLEYRDGYYHYANDPAILIHYLSRKERVKKIEEVDRLSYEDNNAKEISVKDCCEIIMA